MNFPSALCWGCCTKWAQCPTQRNWLASKLCHAFSDRDRSCKIRAMTGDVICLNNHLTVLKWGSTGHFKPWFLQWVNDGSTLTSFITWACWDILVSEDLVRLQVGLEQFPSTGHWLLQCACCSWLGLLNLLMMKGTPGLHHKGHLSEIELRVHSTAMGPKLHIQCPYQNFRVVLPCINHMSLKSLSLMPFPKVIGWFIPHFQNPLVGTTIIPRFFRHFQNPAVFSALPESRALVWIGLAQP